MLRLNWKANETGYAGAHPVAESIHSSWKESKADSNELYTVVLDLFRLLIHDNNPDLNDDREQDMIEGLAELYNLYNE